MYCGMKPAKKTTIKRTMTMMVWFFTGHEPPGVLRTRVPAGASSLGAAALSVLAIFFNLFGGLPKEKIGRDGCAENSDEDGHERPGPFNVRNERRAKHRRPIWFRKRRGDDVCEQH